MGKQGLILVYFLIFTSLAVSCKSKLNVDFISELSSGICPSGYILIPANQSLGVADDFCVMKYEVKNAAGYPVSISLTSTIDTIPATTAKTMCQSLNILNNVSQKFDLISKWKQWRWELYCRTW